MTMKTLLSILVAALVTAFLSGCQEALAAQKTPEGQPPRKPPVAVEVLKVGKGVMAREINACGTVSGIREASVVSQTQGVIQTVAVSLGQRVVQGQVLASVDETIQKAAYTQAENAAAAAELNIKVIRKLAEAGNASEAELKAALSQASGAHAALLATQKAHEDCRITAPITGYIAEINGCLQRGNFLTPQTTLLRIVDISSLKTGIAVGEAEVGHLKKGLTARVQVPAVGGTFNARVRAIGAGSNAATGSYPVEIEWKNTGDLLIKSGMSARVSIVTDRSDSVILIPFNAIIEREGKSEVLLSLNGKAVIRSVETGKQSGNNVEIVKGLETGELLVTTGLGSISQGDSLLFVLTVVERN